jgi:hypothetical protein
MTDFPSDGPPPEDSAPAAPPLPPGQYAPGGDPDATVVMGAGITVWRALIGPLAVIALIFAVPPTALSLLLAMDFTPPPALPANANAEQALEHQFASSPELVALRTLIERFGPAGIALVVVVALVIVS